MFNYFKIVCLAKKKKKQLEVAEDRLTQLEQCDCPRSCSVNGTVYPDGDSWQSECELCTCSVSRKNEINK